MQNSVMSARLHTGRLKVNPAKKKKDGDKSCSGYGERCATVGLRSSGHRAAGIFIDYTEEHRCLGINSTSAIHKSYAESGEHSRNTKVNRLVQYVQPIFESGVLMV